MNINPILKVGCEVAIVPVKTRPIDGKGATRKTVSGNGQISQNFSLLAKDISYWIEIDMAKDRQREAKTENKENQALISLNRMTRNN
jgi:hypothetical protein